MQLSFELDDVLCTPVKSLTDLEQIGKAEVLPGAREFLVELKEAGHQITVFTHRDSSTALDTERFLDKNHIPYNHIVYNRHRGGFLLFAPDCRQFISWEETRKELEKYGILKEVKKVEIETSQPGNDTGVQELKK